MALIYSLSLNAADIFSSILGLFVFIVRASFFSFAIEFIGLLSGFCVMIRKHFLCTLVIESHRYILVVARFHFLYLELCSIWSFFLCMEFIFVCGISY